MAVGYDALSYRIKDQSSVNGKIQRSINIAMVTIVFASSLAFPLEIC